MPRLLIFAALLLAAPAYGQTLEGPSGIVVSRGEVASPLVQVDEPVEVARGDKFHGGLVKAIRSAQKKGTITRRQALRLRVSLLAPSFRAEAKRLALVQMIFSEDGDQLPRTADGRVDETAINWDGLIMFLEKLLPILLQLLEIFGA
jgi:hypothetical protein